MNKISKKPMDNENEIMMTKLKKNIERVSKKIKYIESKQKKIKINLVKNKVL